MVGSTNDDVVDEAKLEEFGSFYESLGELAVGLAWAGIT